MKTTRTKTTRMRRRRPVSAALAGLVGAVAIWAAASPATADTATAAPTPASSTSAASPAGATASGGSGVATGQSTAAVSIKLDSISPRLPEPTPSTQKVTFQLTLTNDTDTAFSDVQIQLERGVPITRQDLLDQAIATPPATTTITPQPRSVGPLKPHASMTVSYLSTPGAEDMCLCQSGVYPFALVANGDAGDGNGYLEIGRTQVFVPSFLSKPAPVHLSWVWPLIDRPHRGLSDTVFVDDDLAASVAAGGRLERALRTAELATGAGVRMTLLVDPELLDSLAVMVGGYQYAQGKALVAGTGGAAAAAWLTRFAALSRSGNVEVTLTGYADPDIDGLTRAGLPYSTALSPEVQARLQPLLNGTLTANLYWPADGVITTQAFNAAVADGVAAVVVNDSALPDPPNAAQRSAVAPLPATIGQAKALVTNAAFQAMFADALVSKGNDPNDIQTLLSELAVQAAADPINSHYVIATPGRYVDTDPAVAAGVIVAVSSAAWVSSTRIADVIQGVAGVSRGSLRTVGSAAANEVSATQLDQVGEITQRLAAVRDMFTPADAVAVLGPLNAAIQRAQSNAWRLDRAAGARLVNALNTRLDVLSNAVHLVQPTNGTYSLSSQDSPVVVTADNTLAQPVTVSISVTAARGVNGFSAGLLRKTIPANSKSTIQIATHVERLGKFKVVAVLQTPGGAPLGSPVPMTLRVTAIGGVTKIITALAAAVLILALLFRLIRRIRRGPKPTALHPAPAAKPIVAAHTVSRERR